MGVESRSVVRSKRNAVSNAEREVRIRDEEATKLEQEDQRGMRQLKLRAKIR